jgi:hypothetical protein
MLNNSAVTNSINFPKSNIEMALYWEYVDNTRILAMLAILMTATLVVGGTLAATTTPSAFAYQKKKGSQDGSENDNTVTPQNNKQDGIVSGFDNSFNQELQNLICTHPSATCSTEGSEGAATTAGGSTSNTGSTSNAQQGSQGLKEDTGSRSPRSSCTVGGSFTDLVQTICIPTLKP